MFNFHNDNHLKVPHNWERIGLFSIKNVLGIYMGYCCKLFNIVFIPSLGKPPFFFFLITGPLRGGGEMASH